MLLVLFKVAAVAAVLAAAAAAAGKDEHRTTLEPFVKWLVVQQDVQQDVVMH
jgi:hypothetical protein